MLHDNFEMITAPLFYLGNKNLAEIQEIVMSTKTINQAKQGIRAITDLAMMAKKSN